MKTKPDETTLTLWMDGELEGDELTRIEAWAQDHPEILAERDAVQAMSANIRGNIPASIEPPYPKFFNQHILRHIDDEVIPAAIEQQKGSFFQQFGVCCSTHYDHAVNGFQSSFRLEFAGRLQEKPIVPVNLRGKDVAFVN